MTLRPQPTDEMMLTALGGSCLSVVDLTHITRCHHTSISQHMRSMLSRGLVARRLVSRPHEDAGHHVYWVPRT